MPPRIPPRMMTGVMRGSRAPHAARPDLPDSGAFARLGIVPPLRDVGGHGHKQHPDHQTGNEPGREQAGDRTRS